jgi:hypothetical protein
MLDKQTIKRANITLKEIEKTMIKQFNPNYNTPLKLLKELNKNNKKAVFLATKCPNCKNIFLYLATNENLYYYKNYELWNITWEQDATCPICKTNDCLFLQHHTGKVIFDNTNIPNKKTTIINKETIEYCKTPLIKEK